MTTMPTNIIDIFDLLADKSFAVQLRWIDDPLKLPASKGVYVLHLTLEHKTTITVGAMSEQTFEAGHYFYVGSAKGSGGLLARLSRHWRTDKAKKRHWHIDYLQDEMRLKGCWVTTDDHLSECELAEVFGKSECQAIGHLGSSDCDCPSHVFYLPFA